MADQDDRPGRALLIALAAMAGVAVVVGLVVAGVVVGAFNQYGLGSSQTSAQDSSESLYMPRYTPTTSPAKADRLASSPGASEGLKQARPSKTRAPEPAIKLFVAPQSVAPGQRINMNGVYPEGDGVVLKIQRKEGGTWVDFPVTATVSGGSFETWILTSHTGRNQFRMYDEGAQRASNVAAVQVG